MNARKTVLLVALALLLLAAAAYERARRPAFISYRANLRRTTLKLYWKDDQSRRFGSLGRLRSWLAGRGETLVFAMNAGMFNPAYAPQGLFIEAQKTLAPLDTAAGAGNFYLQPNGVFYLTTDTTAHISPTQSFRNDGRVAYATQSGPMLVIDGWIHPAFQPSSANLQIRNGVGILPNGEVLLAMSTTKISFYDFAEYFQKAGCQQALYLDGYVSRTYAPAAGWPQQDGDFGVIIGITDPKP